MSEIAIGAKPADGPFNRGAMLLIIAIGTAAFIATLVLGAYAPDMRSGHDGGAHALSNGATGFSGLVRLAGETGRDPRIARSNGDLQTEDLTIITPEHGFVSLGDILGLRGEKNTLLILPKWESEADKGKGGWVRISGLLPRQDPEQTLAPATPLTISRHKSQREALQTVGTDATPEMQFFAPRVVQTMANKDLRPIVTDSEGRIILAQLGKRGFYILADPDLFNNHGMADERNARAALATLDYLNSSEDAGIIFDVTTNGLGRSQSPLKLAFDPPFLAVTLTIFAAMLLAAIQALVRFGSPRRAERAIAFGKSALVDNSAALVRKAGREAQLGPRYVDVIRDRAAALFRLPANSSPDELDQRLEGLNPKRSFEQLSAQTAGAQTRAELLEAAKSLHQWVEEVQE